MRLVFWQNVISPHQAPFIRMLGTEERHSVTLVAERTMTSHRIGCGWQIPNVDPVPVIVDPNPQRVTELVKTDALHVFSGLRLSPWLRKQLRHCLAGQRRVAVISESPDPRGLAGVLRLVKYTADCIRTRSRLDFVLAMGQLGFRWFQRCRFPAEKLFPFAYTTEDPGMLHFAGAPASRYSVMFVGQCIPRKGIKLVLLALSKLQMDARFTVVGDGPERRELIELARELGLASSVEFTGRLSNIAAMDRLSAANLLVLPSYFDGWGAVVNEALLRGVPVICSDKCGAQDLIAENRGAIFRAGDERSLCHALSAEIGASCLSRRQTIAQWSAAHISPAAIAKYFTAVLQCVYGGRTRPVVPWSSAL